MIHQACKPTLSPSVSVTLIYSYPTQVRPRKARPQLITRGALSARLPCWMSYTPSRSFLLDPWSFFFFFFLFSLSSYFLLPVCVTVPLVASFQTPTRYCPVSELIRVRSGSSHQPRPTLIRTSGYRLLHRRLIIACNKTSRPISRPRRHAYTLWQRNFHGRSNLIVALDLSLPRSRLFLPLFRSLPVLAPCFFLSFFFFDRSIISSWKLIIRRLCEECARRITSE